MPVYEVIIGGETYEVDAPNEQALSIAVQQIGGGSGGKPADGNKVPGWADTIDAYGRGIAHAATLGYNDEIGAALDYAGSKILPWREAKTYDQALEDTRASDAEVADRNPVANIAGNFTGAIGVGSAMAKGGLSMAANAADKGAGLGRVMLGAGLDGAAVGAVQGFGDGEGGVENRARNSLLNSAYGLGMGMASVPAAAAVGKGIDYIGGRLANEGLTALSGISPSAQRYLAKQLSDPQKLAAYREELARLGPDATLADVSPEWFGVARGAAQRPGTRDLIVSPLDARSSAANARLNMDLDASLGRPVIPSQIDDTLAQSQRTVAQRYPEVMRDARAVDTEGLANELQARVANTRGPEQKAIRDVRGYLNIPGTDVLDPNPQALHATRQAIDGLLTNETNPQVIRQLTEARAQVDNMLAGAAPGIKEVDAQFSELARQRSALEQGRPILNNEASALRPQEVQDMLAEGALPQGAMVGPSGVPLRMKQGVRAEIDRAVGTKANDVTALRNIVRGEGDWNREKLGMMFGRDNADTALSAIDREAVFADTAQRITRGSDTALGNSFSKFLDETANAGQVPGDTTMTGLGSKVARALVSGMLQKNAVEEAGRYAEQIGRLSVAQGGTRDAVIRELARMGTKEAVSREREAVVRALITAGGRTVQQELPWLN